MSDMGIRDWIVVAALVFIGAVATVFLFMDRSVPAFGIWAGVHTTLIGAYHWIITYDQKTKDVA